jgi:hypothetical protein
VLGSELEFQRPLLTKEGNALVPVMQLSYPGLLSDLSNLALQDGLAPFPMSLLAFVAVSLLTRCSAIFDARSAARRGVARLFMNTACM